MQIRLSVTRPQGNWNEDPTGEWDKESQLRVSIERKATENNTYANRLRNKSPPYGREEEVGEARISPSNIFPLPKTKQP